MSDKNERALQIAEGLAGVDQRLREACAQAGRTREEVTLIVVTKFFPASDVRILTRAGVCDIGENRDQEAAVKFAELRADPGADTVPRMHFIGQLQTNKAGSVAGYADVVHSVDRVKLARSLARGAQRYDRVIDVLLQVDLRDPSFGASDSVSGFARGGVSPSGLEELAELVEQLPGLRLAGLMSVAPLGEEPARAFERLARLREPFAAAHPQATWLSAGMSGDLEQAVAAGATHVRVGGAILGARPADG